jgi:hypothetical protein
MSTTRQLLVVALAAATLAITAAPASPAGPDLSTYSWKAIYGTGEAPLSNNNIYAIKSVGNDLYLGGSFTNFAGIAAADRVVRWNGTDEEWQALAPDDAVDGPITAGSVKAIEVSGNTVYIGGDFTVTDYLSNPRQNLAWFTLPDPTFTGYWDYAWRGFDGDTGLGSDVIDNGYVNTIFADERSGVLYVGGQFSNGYALPNADHLILGSYNACLTVLGACSATPPHVTVCGGVSISCTISAPNTWYAAGDNGAGGPALDSFVSGISAHPDGGVIVSGNFGNAGGIIGANSIAEYPGPYTSPNIWSAQSGVPSVTMYPTVNFEDTLYVAGWEGIYRRTSGNTWQEICPSSVDIAGEQWTGLAVMSNSLVFVGSDSGLFACNPTTGGATQVLDSGQVLRLAMHNGELIVTGGLGVGSIGDAGNYVARYSADLPPTNRDANRNTNTTLLLITLAALTGLAGVQIRRYV